MKTITTQKQVDEAAPKSAPYALGNNLYLNVEPSGSRQWQFIWKVGGRKQYAGLGSAGGAKGHKVSLVEARRKADAYRTMVAKGGDPRQEKRKGERFADFAQKVVDKLKPTWRNEKTMWGWQRSLFYYCEPLADLPINTPSSELAPKIKAMLDPLRRDHHETARHTRQRLEEVFREAKAAGLREGENPASRESLGWSKSRAKRRVNHRRAMRFEEAPAFFERLDMTVHGHAGLKLLAMTVTRTSEVLQARAGQFRLDGSDPMWTIPMTKNGEPHQIPLTADMLAFVRLLVEGLEADDLLFPGYHEKTMLQAFRAIDEAHAGIDVHGFRSCFKDWAGDQTPFGRDIVEETYGHSGAENDVERAYRQRKAMRKRRQVLTAWNAYLAGRLPLQRDDFDNEDAMLRAVFGQGVAMTLPKAA